MRRNDLKWNVECTRAVLYRTNMADILKCNENFFLLQKKKLAVGLQQWIINRVGMLFGEHRPIYLRQKHVPITVKDSPKKRNRTLCVQKWLTQNWRKQMAVWWCNVEIGSSNPLKVEETFLQNSLALGQQFPKHINIQMNGFYKSGNYFYANECINKGQHEPRTWTFLLKLERICKICKHWLEYLYDGKLVLECKHVRNSSLFWRYTS